jgi:hypothetical protein
MSQQYFIEAKHDICWDICVLGFLETVWTGHVDTSIALIKQKAQ